MLMSWQFWLVFHATLTAIAVVAALYAGNWRMAILMCAGAVTGAVLAVVPLWLAMSYTETKTGVSAGNAGVFFVCTVPLFPAIGLAAGGLIGAAIRGESRPGRGHSPPGGARG
jgi:hypothetical protein